MSDLLSPQDVYITYTVVLHQVLIDESLIFQGLERRLANSIDDGEPVQTIKPLVLYLDSLFDLYPSVQLCIQSRLRRRRRNNG